MRWAHKKKGRCENLSQRWAIRFAIEGDLRFCSHHDMMRAVARASRRAGLGLRYSQGFNPRPRLSLVCPRPVGVATRDDLLVLSLDVPGDGVELLRRLNDHAPRGMRLLRAEGIVGPGKPLPVRARYELRVTGAARRRLRRRLGELACMDCWPVERKVFAGRAEAPRSRTIDLKPLVERVGLAGETLEMNLVRRGDLWARPAEVLRLVGLDGRADLAGAVRTEVEYET